ncbi:hypothetical protein ACFWY5_12255 [Nonomuraea sp. NPDC059007]|uniref:hypothetical protein n=1 Tax=Nonomuraea sp. NPDC059007 TaxID=3346692 RepID=UPI00368BCDC3
MHALAAARHTADLAAIAAAAGDPTTSRQRLYGGQSTIATLITTADGRRLIHKQPHPTRKTSARSGGWFCR